MSITISVGAQKLSDGSEVFNVYFGDGGELVLHAYSEEDANELAGDIMASIQRLTCDDVRLRQW